MGERRELGIADAQITETVPEYRMLRFLATLSQIINLVYFLLALHPTKLQNFPKILSVDFFFFDALGFFCLFILALWAFLVLWKSTFFSSFSFSPPPKLKKRFNI